MQVTNACLDICLEQIQHGYDRSTARTGCMQVAQSRPLFQLQACGRQCRNCELWLTKRRQRRAAEAVTHQPAAAPQQISSKCTDTPHASRTAAEQHQQHKQQRSHNGTRTSGSRWSHSLPDLTPDEAAPPAAPALGPAGCEFACATCLHVLHACKPCMRTACLHALGLTL